MAAVMGATYPEIFAAAAIHSGLAFKSANDLISAFAAMRGEAGHASRSTPTPLRTILFHGTADQTVHPSNTPNIIEEASRAVTPEPF